MISRTKGMKTIDRYGGAIQLVLFLTIAFLYVYIAYTSFGYDDEYYNIRIVTDNNLRNMVGIVQSTDIHPPLSYILNHLLFTTFHSWNAVRVVSALFFLVSLAYIVYTTRGNGKRLLLLLLLGLNPTILLWGTSLRWYAYAMPILLFLSRLPSHAGKWYWARFFLGFLFVFFLGYIGFILCIPYFLYYWLNDKSNLKTKILRVLAPAVVFAIVYAWQFYIFVTVHTQSNLDNNQQVFDLKTSLLSIISSCLSNQGVFPLSWPGIISIAGSLLIMVSSILYSRQVNKEKHWLVFSMSVLLVLVAGIAGKIRNLVLLEPSRNLFIATAATVRKKGLVTVGIVLVLLGNGVGVYHVCKHTRTTKNAWNIPLQETMVKVEALERIGVKEIYFTHHPTFTYYLAKAGKNLVSFYNTLYFDSSRIKTSVKKLMTDDTLEKKNITFLLTYRGNSISVPFYKEMLAAMNSVTADSIVRMRFGPDEDYRLKKKFFHDYPQYMVEVIKAYGVKSIPATLSTWEKGK